MAKRHDENKCLKSFKRIGRVDMYDEYGCTCNIIVGLDYKTNSPALIFDKIGSE